MFRLLARDRLKEGEVRPYVPNDLDANLAPRWENGAEHPDCEEVNFESLDLMALGPYLVLLAAKEQAESIIADAQADAEHIRSQAQVLGLAQGKRESTEELIPSLVAFGDAGQSLIVLEEQLISRYTPELVRLALEIAEKVIGGALQADPAVVASILERAKRQVVEAREIRIWLNPKDMEILSNLRPDLVQVGTEGGRRIEVVASDEVSRGGCRLETEMGLVDATVPTQIEEIRRQLLDEDYSPSDVGSALPATVKS